MASKLKAVPCLFIFCEGAHDVAFVRLVLKNCLGFDSSKNSEGDRSTFGDYPAPLDRQFKTLIVKHATSDHSLETAHKFFLPYDLLIKDDVYIVLFNIEGKDHFKTVKGFLADFLPLLPSAMTFPGESGRYLENVRYLFIFDADHKHAHEVVSEKSKDLARIEGIDSSVWTMPDISVADGKRGAFADDKGFYIWSGDNGRGTIEDLLAPLFEAADEQLYQKAVAAIDDMHSWKLNHNIAETASGARSKRQKAIFTTMGQGKKPGFSLSVIIDQAKLLEPSGLRDNPEVTAFVAFIKEFAFQDGC